MAKKRGIWPQIGDEVHDAPVCAIGIKDGERWVMTVDKRGVVSLWPEGTWGYWTNNALRLEPK